MRDEKDLEGEMQSMECEAANQRELEEVEGERLRR